MDVTSPPRTTDRYRSALCDVAVDVADGVVTVLVRGEVDLAAAEPLTAALDRALAAAPRRIVVDLRELGFIDSTGVQAVARAARRAADLRVLPGPALEHLADALHEWLPDAAPARAPATGYEHLMPLFAERRALPDGDPRRHALRTELITGYLPVARHIARRYRHRGENLEDLEQVATVGLINAVDRFDADRRVDFLSFAVPTITGEVQRHHRDRSSTIRVPRRIRQLRAAVLRATDDLRSADGRAPRPSRIAEHLGIELGEVVEALEAGHRTHCSSLDEPLPGADPTAENVRFADALSTTDHDLDLVDYRESLGPALAALPERERRILLLRFFGNQTQSQIAARFGISQMHVSRLLSSSLARLRAALAAGKG